MNIQEIREMIKQKLLSGISCAHCDDQNDHQNRKNKELFLKNLNTCGIDIGLYNSVVTKIFGNKDSIYSIGTDADDENRPGTRINYAYLNACFDADSLDEKFVIAIAITFEITMSIGKLAYENRSVLYPIGH